MNTSVIIKKINKVYSNFRHLFLYGAFGATAAGLDYCTYFILLYFNITENIVIANAAGNLCGFVFTFITNTFWNFRKKDKLLFRFLSYGCICFLGTLISSYALDLSENFLNPYISKIIVMSVVSVIHILLKLKVPPLL